ncbi:co-chaperone YbbN [Ruicaihuangia caeni]|uniref:Tetratricopeptide repeat protein n=1 Tax=Ruicaihuangia caeni TaxID=3042517 RepID=A0AAW6T6L7_9MICO|nr:tetratricopeptide repeat protein [Klugiella sp. YN-L-19]MDI2097735.1 tetratricopeptide repeat protein [Klugiella sp. YN-L-19]
MSNPATTGPNLRGAVDLSSLAARPADGSAAATDSVVFESDDRDFGRVLELSNRVPVIVEFYGAGLQPALGPIVESYGGRLALATVDGNANPQLAQAFQVGQVPAASAVVAGRPLPLFVGTPEDEQVRQVFDQVLQLAAQNGVTGQLTTSDADAAEQPVEEPLSPAHQEAFDAIQRGDYQAALRAYDTAIAQDPRDQAAVAGRAQVALLQRLDGKSPNAIRVAAAQHPGDVHAQFEVADLDISGGHVDDAFDRILEIFPTLRQPDKNRARERMVEYFEIVGNDDPRVMAARRRLTALLY